MQSAVKVPIFNIIEETKKRVVEFGYKKVGLFASESTNKLRLYQKRFADSDIEVISPNSEQQKILNRVIKHHLREHRSAEQMALTRKLYLFNKRFSKI